MGFVDSNIFDAFDPHDDMGHNLCGQKHNHDGAICPFTGPASLADCPGWFRKLWLDQMHWLENSLPYSTAEWQVIITHFPPEWGADDWKYLSARYGIDLIIAGHRHTQEVWSPTSEGNHLKPTAWIVSGGGGGITSDGIPEFSGNDDKYGFMDLTLAKTAITIEAISHGGQLRSTTIVTPRPAGAHAKGNNETKHRFFGEEKHGKK